MATHAPHQLIQNIVALIENGDDPQSESSPMEDYIVLLNLPQLPQAQFDKLFIFLSRLCKTAGNQPAVSYLMQVWSGVHTNFDNTIPYETKIFFFADLEKEVVAYIMRSIQYTALISNPMFHLSQLANYDNSESTILASQRIVDVYSESRFTLEDWQALRDRARDRQFGLLEDFALHYIKKLSPIQKKPKWVRNVYNFTELPTHGALLESAPNIGQMSHVSSYSVSDIVEILTAGLSREGIGAVEMEESKESLSAHLSMLTKRQLTNLLKGQKIKDVTLDQEKIIEDMRQAETNQEGYELASDDKLFSYLGPANPFVDAVLDGDHECCRFGGCRMFLCRCFERYDDDPDQDVADLSDDVDWFTGKCDECGTTIPHRWEALRLMRPHGGWVGVFCQKCLEKQSTDPVTSAMIATMMANLDVIGIQDRVEDEV